MNSPADDDLEKTCREGRALKSLRKDVRHQLASEHITTVFAKIVASKAHLSEEELTEIGFPADFVADYSDPTDPATFEFTPAMPGFSLVPESANHPLHHARLQIPSTFDGAAIGLKVLRDMLNSLDPNVHFSIAAPIGAQREELNLYMKSWGQSYDRVSIFEHAADGFFAQDNAVAGTLRNDNSALLLPRPGGPRPMPRDNLDPKGLSEHFNIPVVRSRLYWEGGNILFDGLHCLIGANTIAMNMKLLGLNLDEVIAAFGVEFGVSISVIGDIDLALENNAGNPGETAMPYAEKAGQADFHIDLDICLLGPLDTDQRPVAVLADPEAGWQFLPDILAQEHLFESHFLSSSETKDVFVSLLRSSTNRRIEFLRNYEAFLIDLGYQIMKMPDVRIFPDENILGRVNFIFNYTNAIAALDSMGKKRVYLFRYGVDELDQCAFNKYVEVGVEPMFIGDDHTTANETFKYFGGAHCLYSKVE